MRIRKRFPLSSLSSRLLSDPQLNRSPMVQQHLEKSHICSQPFDSPNQTPPPPSDQHPMIETAKDVEGGEGREKTNYTRKACLLGAEVGCSSHHQEVGMWCEGDKVVPPKKRRDFGAIMEREKKTKAKMKSKTNKKYAKPNKEQGSKANEEGDNGNNRVGKKLKRGDVIMEGSRCSRVNGRGWRCCQQTLVGYSLCEHHLCKGRLRSIATVRYPDMTTTTSAPKKDIDYEPLSISSAKLGQNFVDDYEDDDDDEDEEEKPLMMTKKRMKLGMVKARSISSLLSQTNHVVLVADNDKIK
ncbi:Growth-regulating factor like [Actinidia chinensis var. chinensis]|uniref:Growth-regulating factor like n=1 Tax=Actinidia chinensis var. chinensis TaxID=1590841 RepID=A0A2R6P2Q5_ACTCC|nr:Growth-regulating factor like [Actinidia chinensis var. chinensis]